MVQGLEKNQVFKHLNENRGKLAAVCIVLVTLASLLPQFQFFIVMLAAFIYTGSKYLYEKQGKKQLRFASILAPALVLWAFDLAVSSSLYNNTPQVILGAATTLAILGLFLTTLSSLWKRADWLSTLGDYLNVSASLRYASTYAWFSILTLVGHTQSFVVTNPEAKLALAPVLAIAALGVWFGNKKQQIVFGVIEAIALAIMFY